MYGASALAESQLRGCPERESAEVLTGGREPIQFQYSPRFESVTFFTEDGAPSIPDEGEVAALAKAVEQAKLGTILQGLSMRDFGTVLIGLAPGVDPEEQLPKLLGRNQVTGRDRKKGTGNPIYDAGDVDYLLVNQIVVQFKAGVAQADINELLTKYCAQTVSRRERAGRSRHVLSFEGQTARHALAMTNRLTREEVVDFAQPDFIVVADADVQSGPTAVQPTCPTAASSSGVDPYFSQQWYLEHSSSSMGGDPNADVNAPAAWGVAEGNGVILAVLDDAVEVAHEDFTGKIYSQWNAFDGSNNLGLMDRDRHGTAVAGIAGALTGNAHGIKATAPEVKLMPVRVMRWMDARGGYWEYPYTTVIDGIELAAASGAQVISMSVSLGKYDLNSCDNQNPPSCQGDLEAAVGALSGSATLVFSAGNYGSEVVFPARLAGSKPNVIAVGATDEFDKIKTIQQSGDWGSSHGQEISVVAPGVEVITTDRTGSKGFCNDNYVVFLGTSAATPIVAGIAALMQSQYMAGGGTPLTPTALKSRMQQTAVDLGPAGFDEYYGHGRVDACKALKQGTCPADRRPWIFLAAAIAAVGLFVAYWFMRAQRK
jgi:subtilisin family serine protease